ncbi:beta-ketoacyl synthase N-terminal-like domain-containing protein, partial [Actinocorallia aurantiaca]
IAACDAADREALARIVETVPPHSPLRMVVHAAGLVADGLAHELTAERIDPVLRAKVDAAAHLDDLTHGLGLDAFVVFSALAGTLGGAGQASYAGANAALDALVLRRRAAGLPALSLAWGLWAEDAGMGGRIGAADRARMARSGVLPLSAADGLALFDAALHAADPVLVPVRLDHAVLRALGETAPPALRSFTGPVRRPRSEHAETGGLAARLTALPPHERDALLLALVREQAALVLGHSGAGSIDADRPFRDLGFDSLTGVELRNRLHRASGLRLPATLVFDHPTPAALAARLRTELFGDAAPAETSPAGSASDEPIAIIGMACRYGGGIASPDDLWRTLTARAHNLGGFPDDRGWPDLYHPDPDHPGTTYARGGGFLTDAADFDNGFFGISPREALAMDPQQRLLLETTWETLENAGLDPAALTGTATGVFAGASGSSYGLRVTRLPEEVGGYLGTGTSPSVISGRVSYTFGFEGPAVTVDTACSSSLVAIHLAAQALRRGECSLALASGVAVMAEPDPFVDFSRQRGLAADSLVKAFSATADGTAWGEGAGVLLLERLSDARRNGHRVLAIVRGSAVNQDGASNGLTAPNGPSQQRVIRAALADAGLAPSDVDAVEAHGTGTRLGDPIEAQALIATYGQNRETPLWLGSVKSNLGHTQAAAGVAGVIKMILALRNSALPATLHVTEPTPEVDWDAGAVALLTEDRPWEPGERPRRAGISSFGISGTNAHVIIEEAPATGPAPHGDTPEWPAPWVLSARSPEALRAQAARLLDAPPDAAPAEIAWNLATRRAAHPHRAVVLGADAAERTAALTALARGEQSPYAVTGTAKPAPGPVFAFTGQGSQHQGMGSGLAATFPVFAHAYTEACTALDRHLDLPLRQVIDHHPDLLTTTLYTQPALFALETALYRLVTWLGITPSHLIGHSIGEITAAHCAGILDLDDAALLITTRARLMNSLPEGGAMAGIAAPEDEVRPLLTPGVTIAAVNSPISTVVAGDTDAVTALVARFRETGRADRLLRVSHAFHSPRMDPVLEAFHETAATLTYRPAQIPIIAATNGTADHTDPAYWTAHIREPVDYRHAAESLVPGAVVVELGPGATLTTLHDQTRPDGAHLSLLRRDHDETTAFLRAAARLHTAGIPFDLARLTGTGHPPLDLPAYPFQHRSYWLADTARGLAPVSTVDLSDGQGSVLTTEITDPEAGPSTVLELAFQAAAHTGAATVAALDLAAPLAPGTVQTRVHSPGPNGDRTITVSSPSADGSWAVHATGTLTDRIPAAADRPGPTTEGAEATVPDGSAHLLHPGLLADLSAVSWRDVRLHAAHAEHLRIHLTELPAGGYGLWAEDPSGAPVVTAASVTVGPWTPAGGTPAADLLYDLTWEPFAAEPAGAPPVGADLPDPGEPVPDRVYLRLPVPDTGAPSGDARAAAVAALDVIRRWLTTPAYDQALLVLLTPDPDLPAAAAVWGMVRSAQAENPGRLAVASPRA